MKITKYQHISFFITHREKEFKSNTKTKLLLLYVYSLFYWLKLAVCLSRVPVIPELCNSTGIVT